MEENMTYRRDMRKGAFIIGTFTIKLKLHIFVYDLDYHCPLLSYSARCGSGTDVGTVTY